MIQLQLGDVGIIVLEPENIRRIQQGNPLRVPLEEFKNIRILALDFTTDAEWCAEAIGKHIERGGAHSEIPKIIEESAKRPEPPLRPNHAPVFFVGAKRKGDA